MNPVHLADRLAQIRDHMWIVDVWARAQTRYIVLKQHLGTFSKQAFGFFNHAEALAYANTLMSTAKEPFQEHDPERWVNEGGLQEISVLELQIEKNETLERDSS